MGVEQAIFTACETGITRQGSGFQIYSYSSGMERLLNETDAAIMFAFEPPNFERMPSNERLNLKNYPRKFAYRMVEEKRKLVSFASSHLADDVRYGNYFSHILVTSLQMVTGRPCEYYRSPLFLEGLSKEEKERKTRPEYLYKETVLEEGGLITFDLVKEFLRFDNRLAKLKYLLNSLLSTDKRIVIVDENKGKVNHIILWIAAVSYMLPSAVAKELSFSDYEYDPVTADFRICGTIKDGTRYKELTDANSVEVFDFIGNSYPKRSPDSELFDVMELSYKVSRDCIKRFQHFMEDFSYSKCNEELLAGYELFKLTTIPDYITKMTKQKLHNALEFANAYAREETKHILIKQFAGLLEEKKVLESRVLRELLYFFQIQVKENRLEAKRLILPLLRQLYGTLTIATKEESRYRSILKELEYFFEQINIPLHKYYLGSLPARECCLLIRKTSYDWQLNEIIRMLKNYILTMKPTISELAQDDKFNAILNAVLLRCETACPSGKKIEYRTVLKEFAFDPGYETYLYLFLERNLFEVESKSRELIVVQKAYAAYFDSLDKRDRLSVYEYLMMENQHTILFLFENSYEHLKEFRTWFDTVEEFIEAYNLSRGELLDLLMQFAFDCATKDKTNRYEAVEQLFHYSFKIGYRDRFINRLIPYLSASIPLVVTKEEQLILIKKLYYYQVNFNGGMIEKRVALCYRLYELKQFLESNPKKREKITFQKKVSLPTMDGVESANYLKRVGAIIGEIIYKNGQVSLMTDCYQLNEEKQKHLFFYIYKTLLKKGRKKKEYMSFLHAFVYVLDDSMSDAIADLILQSGAKPQDITRQLEVNITHLTAYRHIYDEHFIKDNKIEKAWLNILKRLISTD